MEAQLAKLMSQKLNRRNLLTLVALGAGTLSLGACTDEDYVIEPETMPEPTATPELVLKEIYHELQAQLGYLTSYTTPSGEVERRYGHPNFDAKTPLPSDLVLIHDGEEYIGGRTGGGVYSIPEDVYFRDREYLFLFDQSERPEIDKAYLKNSRGDTKIGGYSVKDTQWRNADEVFHPDHLLPEAANDSVFSFLVSTVEKVGNSDFRTSKEGENVRRVMNHDHFVVFERKGEQPGEQISETYRIKAPV